MKRVLSFMLALCAALGMVCLGEPAQAAGKKLIAVTYDDGPGPYTERLLDGLKKRGVRRWPGCTGKGTSLQTTPITTRI